MLDLRTLIVLHSKFQISIFKASVNNKNEKSYIHIVEKITK